MAWDGENRRKEKDNNDLLIEIHSDLRNFLKNFENHLREDRENFAEINKKLDFQQKIVYGGMGILLFVEFIVKVIK